MSCLIHRESPEEAVADVVVDQVEEERDDLLEMEDAVAEEVDAVEVELADSTESSIHEDLRSCTMRC